MTTSMMLSSLINKIGDLNPKDLEFLVKVLMDNDDLFKRIKKYNYRKTI